MKDTGYDDFDDDADEDVREEDENETWMGQSRVISIVKRRKEKGKALDLVESKAGRGRGCLIQGTLSNWRDDVYHSSIIKHSTR